MFELFMKWFSEQANNTNLFCGFIVLVAVGSFIFLDVYLLRHMFFSMNRVILKMRIAAQANEYSISHMTEEIDKSQSSLMKNLWRDYLTTLERTRHENPDHVVDIAIFFNRSLLLDHPGKRRISEAIPGILTALGILGTFIGLVAGLNNVNLTDTDSIRESLQTLMHGLNIAFYTSVYGVLLSVLWTVLDRIFLERHMGLLKQFVQLHRANTPSYGTNDFLKDMLEVQKEQSNTVKHLGTDIAMAISESMDKQIVPSLKLSMGEAFSETMSPSMDALAKTVEQFSQYASEVQSEGMGKVVDSFVENMNIALDGQFQNLADTIQKTCEWQEKIREGMDSLIEELSDSVRDQKEINLTAEDVIKSLSKHMTSVYEVNDELKEHLATVQELSTKIFEQSQINLKVSSDVQEIQEQVLSRIQSYATQIQGQTEVIAESWDETKTALQQMNQALSGSMHEFSTQTHEGLHRTFAIFDEHLSEITKHLAGTISEVSEVMDELPKVLLDLKKELVNAND